jgi:hypothetical protein
MTSAMKLVPVTLAEAKVRRVRHLIHAVYRLEREP